MIRMENWPLGHSLRQLISRGSELDPREPPAPRTGKERLRQICVALGIKELSNTAQLRGKQLKATVRIKPASDGYEARNEVVRYSKLEAA